MQKECISKLTQILRIFFRENGDRQIWFSNMHFESACSRLSGNLHRILASIDRALELGATVRVGPELEVTGYGCEDAFYEVDTVHHSWQIVGEILKKDYKHILINISMPVLKDASLYNCIIVILNSKIVLIRPKNRLAITGCYRENRWFTAWGDGTKPSLTWFQLPSLISSITGQKRVPFGDGVILEITNHESLSEFSSSTVRIGYEICEELWQPDTQTERLFGFLGCDLVMNVSGLYWELRTLDAALTFVRSATERSGGVYAHVNSLGCDGDGRLCYYGRSFVVQNGNLLAMTTLSRETLFDEVEVCVVWVDPNATQQYRSQKNITTRAFKVGGNCLKFNPNNLSYDESHADAIISRVSVINIEGFNILRGSTKVSLPLEIDIKLAPEEEILRYCCLWLWDYLRRTISDGLKGFIVPLDGGLNSCAVACILYCLSKMLHYQIYERGNQVLKNTLAPIFDAENHKQATSEDICNNLLLCCYFQTEFTSSNSRFRAKSLAELIGAQFEEYNFDNLYKDVVDIVPKGLKTFHDDLKFQQNVGKMHSRLRMVLTYYMSERNRLVLATGNIDESLVGYMTKYGCSSGDINPIGSISRRDLKSFVNYCKSIIPNSETVLEGILTADQNCASEDKDEDDLGLTYEELNLFGKIRRGQYGTYGPYGMFAKLWDDRSADYVQQIFSRYRDASSSSEFEIDPNLLAAKVKQFFTLYARNRHKQAIITPALHAETYSPDDSRFDHRQLLFNTKWPWQFGQIDTFVQAILKKKM